MGYDTFAAQKKNLPRYIDLFGIDPNNQNLMETFDLYGTNRAIGIDLPLQTAAMEGDLISNYMLVTNDNAILTFMDIAPLQENIDNVRGLVNYDSLPESLKAKFGNSTLANIAAVSACVGTEEQVVAMAYDSRKNYE